jgi:Lipopolysaccharide-assembly
MFRRTFLFLAASVLLTGCAHYQLGTGGKLTFATLYVEPVTTKVLIPQAQAIVSTQLRTAFTHDGRVSLVNSPEAADATLKIVLTEYRREVSTQRAGDSGLARKFTLIFGATATLTDNRTSRPLFTNRIVTVHRDIFTDEGNIGSVVKSNQLQAEYQALPLLADALTDKLTHTVLDVW